MPKTQKLSLPFRFSAEAHLFDAPPIESSLIWTFYQYLVKLKNYKASPCGIFYRIPERPAFTLIDPKGPQQQSHKDTYIWCACEVNQFGTMFSHKIRYECHYGAWPRGSVVGWGSMLLVGRSRVRFPMRLLDFSFDLIVPASLWPWDRHSP
jgi:hypothetical protein